jgi:predicted enzyme related to lactoylglutathione lyase
MSLTLAGRQDDKGSIVHKSKLSGFIIDCQTSDLESAARFWGAALGMELHRFSDPEQQNYIRLMDEQHGLHIEVQRVSHASRVHLDIESDDVDAEVARLEALGAKRIEKIKSWWVMQAPTGQRFCVVRKDTESFDARATAWT